MNARSRVTQVHCQVLVGPQSPEAFLQPLVVWLMMMMMMMMISLAVPATFPFVSHRPTNSGFGSRYEDLFQAMGQIPD